MKGTASSLHSLFRFLTDPELETFIFQNFPEGNLPSWLHSGSCVLPEYNYSYNFHNSQYVGLT